MTLPIIESVDINLLLSIAREAGMAILKIYEMDFIVKNKSDNSPLTEADLVAHEIITEKLQRYYPEIPIISEENIETIHYKERKKWDSFWLIDPLDGTKEFIKRNGQFTVRGRPHTLAWYTLQH